MTRHPVRQAVRATILSGESGGTVGRKCDAPGSRGIGTVLQALHQPTASEPLPPELAQRLQRLREAEGTEDPGNA